MTDDYIDANIAIWTISENSEYEAYLDEMDYDRALGEKLDNYESREAWLADYNFVI